MSTCSTVCVRGYPATLPLERVADKLMIHFLRTRNGGGEIVNIEFAPESPDCAVITFEDVTVAQRVLKAKEHILSVNGKKYPLEVTAYPAELNPNECVVILGKCILEVSEKALTLFPQIFVCVHMKIDYGCFPSGKDILCHLQKQYSDVHFIFDSQEMTCSVKGSFTVLQAFSSQLLRCLKKKQSRSLSEASRERSSGITSGDGASHNKETQKENKIDGNLLPVQTFGESHVEPMENFSLVIDSDVYFYMQAFCCEEVNHVLGQHKVNVVDVSSDGVTTLYFQAASSEAGGVSALMSAHLAISQLSQQLEGTLRKEKISKKELGVEGGIGLLKELQKLCPMLLCHEDHEYFYFVGSSINVSEAKLHVQNFIDARRSVQDHQKPSAAQTSHVPLIHTQSVVPAQLESPAESVPSKLSSPTFNDKTEHKLAAKFTSRPSLSNQDALLVEKLPRDFPQTVDCQVPDNGLQFLAAADTKSESQVGQPMKFQKPPKRMKEDLLLPMSGNTVSGTEGFTRFGLERPSSSHIASNTFKSLNLFDTTGCVDPKMSEPRPFLRRSSSLQKPLNSSNFTSEPQGVATVSLDHVKQEVQEHSHHTLQKEISKEGMSQVEKGSERVFQNTEQRCFSSTSVQRNDRDLLDMMKAENLATHPDYIWDSFSYSELALEGPEDKSLTDLCNYLKYCHDQVIINQDKYRLGLAYPREVSLQIQEAFRFFSDQRMASLTKRLHSYDAQQGKSQDEIQESPQQPKESYRASLSESLPCSSSLAREKSSSQAEKLLDAKGAHPQLVHDFPSNWKVWQIKCFDKTPDASKQDCPRKTVSEVKPGLPDKFHFAKSCSREGSSHTAERGSQSLPVLPREASDSTPSQRSGKHTPPAGEGVASDVEPRAATPGRESRVEECELCQSSHTATYQSPCNHTPSRARFSTGKISPPDDCATSAIPGTFTAATLSQSLPGYYRDPTLKLIYDIPDGVQQARHPRPGHPYQGGRFEAFLPDNPEGQRLMLRLHKAFERGLTFQIQTCGSEEKFFLGSLQRNGYPDAQYLHCIHLKLKELGIE
ncbi:hypothetical protein JD844_002334 [Phrynosoma platyrhinos]|uniref:RING-type E3 ubiquitin transferase n=1 Tax=Phrynosoma platyrhinos TaxID=52577 RepID=A0ABQ7TB78_PHRPL|nr:hypothetical protein JD844_002334 [Phrynosoma platyrhinos]